jgi:hypothetical protein
VRHNLLEDFDRRIDEVLGLINGYTPNDGNSLARSLPVSAGGLGILKSSGIQHETSKIQSCLRILLWTGSRPEELHLATITRHQLEGVKLGAYNHVVNDVDLSTLAEMDYNAACAMLKKARDKVYATLADRYLSRLLTRAGGGPFAALFRCNLGGPGRQTRAFLKFATSHYSDRDFSDLAFSSLVRFHLGESHLGAAYDQHYCKCNSILPMGHDPSHPWHCRLHKTLAIQRHDRIVKMLQKFIKKVRPSAGVELEAPLGQGSYCRADLRVADGSRSMATVFVVLSDVVIRLRRRRHQALVVVTTVAVGAVIALVIEVVVVAVVVVEITATTVPTTAAGCLLPPQRGVLAIHVMG